MKSIAEIKKEFSNTELSGLKTLIHLYQDDERAGVKALIAQANKKLDKLAAEYVRLEGMRTYEKEYRHLGSYSSR